MLHILIIMQITAESCCIVVCNYRTRCGAVNGVCYGVEVILPKRQYSLTVHWP